MEPVSLTLGAIVAALVAKAFEGAVEGATEGAVDRGVLGRLVARLRARLAGTGDEEARKALAGVQDVPDSPSRVQTLARVIDERVQRDDELRTELEGLVAQARSSGVDVESISQTVWCGDQNVQAGRLIHSQVNVSYGTPPPARPGA